MTALFVLNTKRELDKGQKTFTDKTVRILIAHIEAYEKRIAELEKKPAAQTAKEA